MRTTRHLLTGLIVTLALGAAPVHSAIKCWTNRDGVRECGNEVPPEYAQQKTRSISDGGLTIEEKARAKPAQPAAVAQPEQTESPDEQRRREEQEKSDRVLLATFTTEQDIIRARDRQLAALKDQVEYTRLNMSKLEAKIAEYKKKIEDQERKGKPASDDLRQDMGVVQSQVEKKQTYIAAKLAEIDALQAKYDRDLLRFRELMQQGSN